MTYTPSTPANGAENISISNPKIRENFETLNTLYGLDHFAFDTVDSTRRGLHQKISFRDPLAVDPPTSSTLLSLYSKNDVTDESARPQLYCQNVNGVNDVRQITNRFISSIANNGYLMLPNGTANTTNKKPIIQMWGTVTVSASNSNTNYEIVFPEISNYAYPNDPNDFGFPNNLLNFQFSITADNISSTPANFPLACINSGTVAHANGRQYMNVLVSGSFPTGSFNWYAIGN